MCPGGWEIAKVTPIYTDGDRGNLGNYRPISVLPALSKIMERIALTQLSDYLDKYSILLNSQHGFRKHYSETCCLDMLDQMYIAIDNGKVGGVVFLDLEKVLENGDHGILIRKLGLLGISDGSLSWFVGYSSDGARCTQIGNVTSECKPITHGVLQGSILGPLLFPVDINICDVIKLSESSMYADDPAIFSLLVTLMSSD